MVVRSSLGGVPTERWVKEIEKHLVRDGVSYEQKVIYTVRDYSHYMGRQLADAIGDFLEIADQLEVEDRFKDWLWNDTFCSLNAPHQDAPSERWDFVNEMRDRLTGDHSFKWTKVSDGMYLIKPECDLGDTTLYWFNQLIYISEQAAKVQ